jgi:hypothetical protein
VEHSHRLHSPSAANAQPRGCWCVVGLPNAACSGCCCSWRAGLVSVTLFTGSLSYWSRLRGVEQCIFGGVPWRHGVNGTAIAHRRSDKTHVTRSSMPDVKSSRLSCILCRLLCRWAKAASRKGRFRGDASAHSECAKTSHLVKNSVKLCGDLWLAAGFLQALASRTLDGRENLAAASCPSTWCEDGLWRCRDGARAAQYQARSSIL